MVRITPISPPSVVPSVKWKSLPVGQACILYTTPTFIYLKLGRSGASLAFDVESGRVCTLEGGNLEDDRKVIPVKTDIHFDLSGIYQEPTE